ncbi:hypothetical protein [Lacrimispora sp.]
MYTSKNPVDRTKREITAALQIWSRAVISLLDIRHNLIAPKVSL